MTNFEYIKYLASLELEDFKKEVEPRCMMCAYCKANMCTVSQDREKTCRKGFEIWLESEAKTNE